MNRLFESFVFQILIECFRPILPSFQSRLETICPSSTVARTTGGSDNGTVRDIASIYEGMLRFLSLVYESITSGWIDMIESGSITVSNSTISKSASDDSGTSVMMLNNAPALYNELTKVFIQLMAPFKPYQMNLSKLETKFVQQHLSTISQQVQSIVKTVTTTNDIESGWEVLQSTSMDELLTMPDLVIPIIEDTISRHELLNGGHDTSSLLQNVDQIITTYASVLGKAVQTLSSTLVTDAFNDTDNKNSSSTPPTFDESNVLCALQVLKLAGTYKRTIISLQMKTSERLRMSSERMTAQLARDKQVSDAFHLMSLGKNATFQIPETISLVEIDAIVTNAVLLSNDGPNEVSDNATPADASQLFPSGMSSSMKLASSCHTFVFDVCFAIPRYHLINISSMASWKESQSLMESWGGGTGAGSSYGTLPQSFITQVGEHMLALVQALEPFAEDRDALSLSNTVMENDIVRQVAMPYWNDFVVAATGSPCTEESLKIIMEGKELLDLVIGVIPVDDEGNVEDGSEEGTTASTIFCNKWLDVVGLAVAGRLVERIMRIPSLTRKGCEHLNADLGYIVNVFSALGVSGHPHPLLGHIAEICILEKEVIFERLDNLDRSNPSSDFLRSVEERLSAMRGLT
jgi:conserved oligomeric Golgi complex subunit 7